MHLRLILVGFFSNSIMFQNQLNLQCINDDNRSLQYVVDGIVFFRNFYSFNFQRLTTISLKFFIIFLDLVGNSLQETYCNIVEDLVFDVLHYFR